MRRHKLTFIWLAAVVLAAFHVLAFADSAHFGPVDLLNLLISAGVLPFAAGFICVRAGRTSAIATAAAGASVAIATVIGVGIAYAVTTSGWLAFAGFVLATTMFSLVPSGLIGFLGGWVARKYEPSHI
jgi:hypothetical protein